MNKRINPKRKQNPERDKKIIRHTHSTIAGLEDLNAVLNSIAFSSNRITLYMQEMDKELERLTNYYQNALGIIYTVRKSPHSYTNAEFLIKTKIKRKTKDGDNGSN
jgi:hypothetical protein